MALASGALVDRHTLKSADSSYTSSVEWFYLSFLGLAPIFLRTIL